MPQTVCLVLRCMLADMSSVEILSPDQGRGIDCLATHPGIADTRLYPKLDTENKIEAKGVDLFEKASMTPTVPCMESNLCS